jgi:hypothetical protein
MTEPSAPAVNSPLRLATFAVVAAHTLFFVYALFRIFTAPAGDGTGMHIVGIVPLGVLFLVFAFPATSYARSGKHLIVALILALIGFGATQWLWWGTMVNELNLT